MRKVIVSSAFAAMLLAAPSMAMAQTATGSGAFCLKKQQSQALDCAYQTMAQCEKAKIGGADLCSPRAQAAGPKTGMKPSSTGMAPGKPEVSPESPAAAPGTATSPSPKQTTDAPATPNRK